MNRQEIEKAIEILKYYNPVGAINAGFIEEPNEDTKAFYIAIQALEKQLNGGWVSVSERLPKCDNKYNEEDVLVCMDDEFIATTTYVKDKGFELWAESGEVTAWQPLPETYREAEE